MQSFKFDEMWIIPAFQNPLKLQIQVPSVDSRISLLEIGLRTIDPNLEKIKILDIEARDTKPSFTIQTLTDLTKQHPECEFYLCIGADQFSVFDQWSKFKDILKISNLIITSRPGFELPKNKQESPEWLKSSIKQFKNKIVSLNTGTKIFFFNLNDIEVSSSDIRRRIRRGENISHLTPGSVADKIEANKIYDFDKTLVSNYQDFTQFCSEVVKEKGGISVNAYDVRKMVQPSEFTLVASGTSTRHTKALAEHVIKEAKEKYGIKPQNTEGMQEGRWVIVDFGPLLIHLFYDFVRSEYHIEGLWTQGIKL